MMPPTMLLATRAAMVLGQVNPVLDLLPPGPDPKPILQDTACFRLGAPHEERQSHSQHRAKHKQQLNDQGKGL